jgi:hypothetical protein
MGIRWRDLLDHLQVPWTDRGHASRGWIQIKCPWCGDHDPSHHLGINEADGHYGCLRSPQHKGRSPYFLLRSLGARSHELARLIEAYGGTFIAPPPSTKPPASAIARRWQSFTPASRDRRALDYLSTRKFWNPKRTAETFDLRVGTGRWSGRLWFPLTFGSEIVGFTGRAMNGHEPRYLTESSDTVLYLPTPLSADARAAVIVEGPIDALKLADSILARYDLGVAALLGLTLSGSKKSVLMAIAKAVPDLFVALDSTVPAADANRLVNEARPVRFKRLSLPSGIDDPGEMSGEEVDRWLEETGIAALVK